jgi:peptidoglycan LD-endopeptidase CwlK
MKYQFGLYSQQRLDTAHFDLQNIAREALAVGLIDFAITEGHRDYETQNKYYEQGKSKVKFPNSKHNTKPAMAIDAVPYVNGKLSYNYNHCCFLAGIILALAKKKGKNVRWGGNWDMDGEPVTDQSFQDLVHFELTGG